MRALSLIIALTAVGATQVSSQTVIADIHIAGGPVFGHVIIGNPYFYHPAPVVVPRYYNHYDCYYDCRPVMVRHGPPGLIRRYHRVGLWYHPASGRYFDRPYTGLHGLRQVNVREYEGRYWYDD